MNAPWTVLLVEDNAWDAEVTREALTEVLPEARVEVLRDGEVALAYLRREPPHRDAPRPSLVLLDLNLPRKDGRELLAEIKSDPTLRRIPVIILTTSLAQADIKRSYDLHANSYLHKPVDPDAYTPMMNAVRRFWLEQNVTPQH